MKKNFNLSSKLAKYMGVISTLMFTMTYGWRDFTCFLLFGEPEAPLEFRDK